MSQSPSPAFAPNALATCAYCPRLCRDVCPPALGEANEALIPTHKIGLIELWQRGLIELDEGLASTFYACTDCGACTSLCKHKMTPAEILYTAREQALEAGLAPKEVNALLDTIAAQGNPYGPIDTNASAPLPTSLFVGCAGCSMQPERAERYLEALQKVRGTQVGIFAQDSCCGAPLAATGAKAKHEAHTNTFANKLQPVSHLIVADPHCFRHLQGAGLGEQAVPTDPSAPPKRRGQDRRISHLFTALEPSLPVLAAEGSPKLAFYHDSAALGRFLGLYDEPRRLLGRLGYQIMEFTRNRDKAMGSGAGGIYRWTSPAGAQRYTSWLLQEVRDSARLQHLEVPPPIITVGETERSHLANAAPDLEILDLNALVVDAILKD